MHAELLQACPTLWDPRGGGQHSLRILLTGACTPPRTCPWSEAGAAGLNARASAQVSRVLGPRLPSQRNSARGPPSDGTEADRGAGGRGPAPEPLTSWRFAGPPRRRLQEEKHGSPHAGPGLPEPSPPANGPVAASLRLCSGCSPRPCEVFATKKKHETNRIKA